MSILLLALATCGGKRDDDKREPVPAAPPKKEVVTGGLNQPTGVPECDQFFAYVADYILVCSRLPEGAREHTRANMDGMNKLIRTKLLLDPDSRPEFVQACTRGIAEAKQTYKKECQ